MKQFFVGQFTPAPNTKDGNPRCIIHFLDLVDYEDEAQVRKEFDTTLTLYPMDFNNLLYTHAAHKYKAMGARKYHGKGYGGGIVFQGTPESVAAKLNMNL
jgi:hypothetical protein